MPNDKFHEWKDYYKWGEDDFLTATDNPCAVCGKRETIGVGYSAPESVTFFCAEHLPEEFWSAERKNANPT
jgi:hypothetical protein